MKLMRVALTGSLLLVLAGCGNDSPVVNPPTTPAPPTTPPVTPPVSPPVAPVPPAPVPSADLTGTWSGTTTTTEYGTEQTAFTFTQSGSQVSGTLTLTDSEGESFNSPVTGSVSGSSATVSGLYDLDGGGELEYRYEGTFSETTYSGTVTLLVDGVVSETGQFSVTRGGGTPAPPVTPPTTPVDLTGTWNGTTTTTEYGVEQTTFSLTQSGDQLTGTLTLVNPEVPTEPTEITGTVNGSAITISAAFELEDIDGVPTGDVEEYQYEGTLSGTTLSGTMTLVQDGVVAETGQFSVTKSN